MVKKAVSIKDYHADWIELRTISLSKYIQKKIDEDIAREKNE